MPEKYDTILGSFLKKILNNQYHIPNHLKNHSYLIQTYDTKYIYNHIDKHKTNISHEKLNHAVQK